MSTRRICDRCKNDIPYHYCMLDSLVTTQRSIFGLKIDSDSSFRNYDLCRTCEEDFLKFMDGTKLGAGTIHQSEAMDDSL